MHGDPGADDAGNITQFEGSMSNENYHCRYFVVQVAYAGDPSICEVYALFYNEEVLFSWCWNDMKKN